jgi:hypothetical protein
METQMDWSEWGQASEEEQRELMRRYREILARERDANRARWNRMSPAERARYPEASLSVG